MLKKLVWAVTPRRREGSSEVATDLQGRQLVYPEHKLLAHLPAIIIYPSPSVSRGKLWQTKKHPQTNEPGPPNVKISWQGKITKKLRKIKS